ncbi:MAG: hypothetical protein LBM61_06205 [Prevotellaceae bacterium]|jgi:hypothetical protein|nr:hypothetical protein [Prevotellaceae bacterium]
MEEQTNLTLTSVEERGKLFDTVTGMLKAITRVDGKACFALSDTYRELLFVSEHPWLLGEGRSLGEVVADGTVHLKQLMRHDYSRFMFYNRIMKHEFEASDSEDKISHFSFVIRIFLAHRLHGDIPMTVHVKVSSRVLGNGMRGLFYTLSHSHVPVPIPNDSRSERSYLNNQKTKLVLHEKDSGNYRVYDRKAQQWGIPRQKPVLTHIQKSIILHAQAGCGHKYITKLCGCSEQHVHNTLSALYKKLEVSSLQGLLCVIDNYQLMGQ